MAAPTPVALERRRELVERVQATAASLVDFELEVGRALRTAGVAAYPDPDKTVEEAR